MLRKRRRHEWLQVVHVITGLNTGGAETMLYKLLARTDRTRFDPIVVSLTDAGPIANKIRMLGVPVHCLGMRRRLPNPFGPLRLAMWLRRWKPDVVQTWMYHADLVGGLAARLARSPPVAWNIRQSNLDPAASKGRTIWAARRCASLSARLPTRIVCCSEVARVIHIELGYCPNRMLVIPNGFDLDSFQANEKRRNAWRDELGLPADAFVVGHVARYDPQKDHMTLLRAAGVLVKQHPQVHFVLCGEGVTSENLALQTRVEAESLQGRIHMVGRRDDMSHVYPAMDVFVSSSSFGEGFPNVIGEAMACQVPCVVTDVGDSAYIVGETGLVVAPSNAALLAEAIEDLLHEGREALARRGLAARNRIVDNFDIAHVSAAYERLYQEMAGDA